jgi:hypothetical protein
VVGWLDVDHLDHQCTKCTSADPLYVVSFDVVDIVNVDLDLLEQQLERAERASKLRNVELHELELTISTRLITLKDDDDDDDDDATHYLLSAVAVRCVFLE